MTVLQVLLRHLGRGGRAQQKILKCYQPWILLLLLFFYYNDNCFVTTAFLHQNKRKNIPPFCNRQKLRVNQATAASSSEAATTKYTAQQEDYYQYKKSRNNNNNYQRHTKIKIKKMFQKAQDLTRTGQWLDASRLLKDILEIDPKDAHSHLALARLESRREIASTATSKSTSYTNSLYKDNSSQVPATSPESRRRNYNSNNISWAMTIMNQSATSTISSHTKISTEIEEEEEQQQKDHQHISSLLVLGNYTAATSIVPNNAKLMDLPPLPSPSSSPARAAFYRGTTLCPKSIHIWQAWALHEQSMGNLQDARTLFQICLTMDSRNAHVCHAFGLMERRLGNYDEAQRLWVLALDVHSTAALVCSLGELLIFQGKLEETRKLYRKHLFLVRTERERTEIYLAMAWLEERHFSNLDGAVECIQTALHASPNNSRAQVALARLQGRREAELQLQVQSTPTSTTFSTNQNKTTYRNIISSKKTSTFDPDNIPFLQQLDSTAMTRLRFAEACEKDSMKSTSTKKTALSTTSDGRLYNAWANLEARLGRLKNARRILLQGIKRFPYDHSVSRCSKMIIVSLTTYS